MTLNCQSQVVAMTATQCLWLESEERFIPAQSHVALLLDLLNDRGLTLHYLLRRTGIFYEDILSGELRISARQFARLCSNVSQLHCERDISFLFGQRLLPGIFDQHSLLLVHAPNLRVLLQHLCDEYATYFPLVKPRLQYTSQHCHLLFEDPFGESARLSNSEERLVYHRFLIEIQLSAIVSFCDWRAGKALPWRLGFDYPDPGWSEQYEVFCGAKLSFGQRYTSMRIALDQLDTPWLKRSATIYHLAQDRVQKRGTPSDALLSLIREMMRREIRQLPSLEFIAGTLQISPATLKRKLKVHHSSYRVLCDEVRMQLAFFLSAEHGYDDEALAKKMAFFDVSNFRRALRRWLAR